MSVVSVLAVAGLVSGCANGTTPSGDDKSSAPVKIVFGYASAPPPNEMEPAIFDKKVVESGALKHYGKDYSLEILPAKGTPAVLTLLASNSAQIGTLGFSTVANAAAKQAIPGGFSVIAQHYINGYPGYGTTEYLVLDSSNIKSADDLRGKTIGVNAIGSAVDVEARAWLTKQGLDPAKDVKFEQIGFGEMDAALRAGRIDVGTFIQPALAMAQQEGGVRTLFTARDGVGEIEEIVVVARNDFLKANPGAVKAFLADWVSGLAWITDDANRDQALEIISKLSNTPVATLDLFYNTKADTYRDPNACTSAERIQRGVDAMEKIGYLDKPLDVGPLVDNSFLPKKCD